MGVKGRMILKLNTMIRIFFFFFFLRCKIKEKEPDTDGKKDERKLCKCQSSKEHQERRFLGEYLESLPLFIFFN